MYFYVFWFFQNTIQILIVIIFLLTFERNKIKISFF